MDFFNVTLEKIPFRKLCPTQVIKKKKKGREEKGEERKGEEEREVFVESWEEVICLLGVGGERYGVGHVVVDATEIFFPEFDEKGLIFFLF